MAYCKHTFLCDSGYNNIKRCVRCDMLLKKCSHCKGYMRKVRIKEYDYIPYTWVYQCYNCLKYDKGND